jgi:hypothetical protein
VDSVRLFEAEKRSLSKNDAARQNVPKPVQIVQAAQSLTNYCGRFQTFHRYALFQPFQLFRRFKKRSTSTFREFSKRRNVRIKLNCPVDVAYALESERTLRGEFAGESDALGLSRALFGEIRQLVANSLTS